MGQRYHRMEGQKPGPVCGHITMILLKGKTFNQQLSFLKMSKVGDVVS